jgi:hypothetical protein
VDEGDATVDAQEPGSRFRDEEQLRTTPATRDRGHVEQLTDEEAALLRRLRFGRLPEPVPPSDWAEAVDTDTQYEPPEPRLGPPYVG